MTSHQALEERLVALRRNLHQHPELSFSEVRTSALLKQELASLDPKSIVQVARTGLVARIAGRDPAAPVVALRGDIDALPITEATALPFTSMNDGVMHACGHDVHAAWAFGAAALLSEHPAVGDVLVVMQPAEEIGEGAAEVMASGALDEAKVIFGAHVDRRFTVGQVVAQPGPIAASADAFEITLVGKGAHGARPQEAADPIVCMAAVITALQTIVSRRVHPANHAVVTVGAVQAGTAGNIIPERAVMKGTLRATDDATRALLLEQVRHIATHVAQAHGVASTITSGVGVPPVINDARAAEWAKEAAVAELGAEGVVSLGQVNMAAEDFAWYLRAIPGCFMRVGARREGEPVIAAHSPQFDVAEEAILVGARVLAESARRASAALAAGGAR